MTCPECGAVVEVVEAEKAIVVAPAFFIVGRSRLEVRQAPCVVAACTCCEWVVERR